MADNSYEQKYKDMMDNAYKGLDKGAIDDFAKKMGVASEAQARQSAIDRSVEDLKRYDAEMQKAKGMWAKAANRPRKIKPAYKRPGPITMTSKRGISSINAKIKKLNEAQKNANPKNDGTISADVFYAEEIPIKMITNHIGNGVVEYIKSEISRDPTAALEKKVIRIFARVKHYNFTPDPDTSPMEPGASDLDHSRTACLPQFYGLFDKGDPTPNARDSIRVMFPDESDTSNGFIVKVDNAVKREQVTKTSAMEAVQKSITAVIGDIAELLT